MENQEEPVVSKYRPLRIWIPLVLLPLMVAARFFSSWFPEIPMVWLVPSFVPGLLGLVILLWWLTLSRATWVERLVGFFGLIAGLALAVALFDKSMLGPPVIVFALPSTIVAFAVALIIGANRLSIHRTGTAVLISFLIASCFALLKNEGATGDFGFDLKYRWAPTSEDVFLASRQVNTSLAESRKPTLEDFQSPEWPGFRGPLRDGIQRGVAFVSEWQQQPPKELWRVRVGPAWSSFAVANSFLVTQEQRGESESVVCYDADTGQEVWAQNIKSRFFDALGGLGPRATPTIHAGSVYAQGAEGLLVKLSAENGAIAWQADLRELTKQAPPMWGYSCSPLVHDGLVIVHAAGSGDKGIIAFDAETGEVRWSVPADKDSYSSVHLTTFFESEQLVFLGASGALFLDPKTGATVLNHEFKITGYRAVQPAVVDSNRLLFTSETAGSRLIELNKTDQGLESTELWTSRDIKPDFNDFVVHEGFIYGFDGATLVCVDLADGTRAWKKGRYGKGQMLLLGDSDLLVVISEQGELVLLEANSSEHRELFKMQALSGKTWNHPVVVGDRLYLRNANEAVCYRLPKK
jgi:outer membrane protein assembly factor BamB